MQEKADPCLFMRKNQIIWKHENLWAIEWEKKCDFWFLEKEKKNVFPWIKLCRSSPWLPIDESSSKVLSKVLKKLFAIFSSSPSGLPSPGDSSGNSRNFHLMFHLNRSNGDCENSGSNSNGVDSIMLIDASEHFNIIL